MVHDLGLHVVHRTADWFRVFLDGVGGRRIASRESERNAQSPTRRLRAQRSTAILAGLDGYNEAAWDWTRGYVAPEPQPFDSQLFELYTR